MTNKSETAEKMIRSVGPGQTRLGFIEDAPEKGSGIGIFGGDCVKVSGDLRGGSDIFTIKPELTVWHPVDRGISAGNAAQINERIRGNR